MTNAEWIRSMNDEELATWLCNISQFLSEKDEEWHVSVIDSHEEEIEIHDSYGDWKNWLEKETNQ